MRLIELSAPARDLACGTAAIDAGADAVYTGARAFGARRAAGNSTEDIRKLASYAHRFRARVYVALNTILYDRELGEARRIIGEVWDAGADALIIQDMGILEMDLPPIPLFASTQTDNRTPEKVKFLEDAGFSRVILARELSLAEIRGIRARTSVELECFAAGALCAGVSGQCWFSLAVCGRSANRGDCAQPCRGRYSVEDADGRTVERDRYPLSLKDLDLSRRLRDLIDAGITTFKIEGRLKDAAYAVNLTSWYRRELDAIIGSVRDLGRSSEGGSLLAFEPDPERTFNRGFTEYRIAGSAEDAVSPLTRKSIGKMAGVVTGVRGGYFTLGPCPGDGSRAHFPGGDPLRNGDGVCLFDRKGVLRGTSVTRVSGERVYPRDTRIAYPGAVLFRNLDRGFLAAMSRNPPERKMPIRVGFEETGDGFSASATDAAGVTARFDAKADKVSARSLEKTLAAVRAQFGKLGGTPYTLSGIDIGLARPLFLGAGFLNTMRRELIARFDEARARAHARETRAHTPNSAPYPEKTLDYRANISNRLARDFYARHGATAAGEALELRRDVRGKTILTARACVRKRLKLCPRRGARKSASAAPLFLVDARRRYRLEFDCERCEMRVVFPG